MTKQQRRSCLINAALHCYSDTSVPISSQEWRDTMDVHTEASGWWLLIIVPEKKNVFLKLTKKTNFCCSCRYRDDFVCFQVVPWL